MNRGNLPSLFALAWCVVGTLGCATGPGETGAADGDEPERVTTSLAPTPEPVLATLSRDDYDAVFDAAVRELRDAGFRIARNDRRFGVITTWPKESPTAFEPWVGDNTTGDLARRSTLNHLRRSVEVRFEPGDRFELTSGLRQVPTDPTDYQLTVAVTLEREQQPDRYLRHSARGAVAARYREVPVHLARQGLPAEYWEPAGDDPVLAQRLLIKISERSRALADPSVDTGGLHLD